MLLALMSLCPGLILMTHDPLDDTTMLPDCYGSSVASCFEITVPNLGNTWLPRAASSL